jgi:hypothetical protein
MRASPAPLSELNRLVNAARAVLRHTLYTSVVLATTAATPPSGSAGPLHATGCAPATCTLEPPTPTELQAIVAEADRLLARYADDATPLGRQCRALGATMRTGVGEVRMLPFMWRAVDPEGRLAAVTGDAHRVEPTPGAGRVHIARGFDTLNPDRGLSAILETARHEFAHLNGMGQREVWGLDAGAQLATACRPPDEGQSAVADPAR